MNYYLVLCKCGHVSRKFYMPIEFCIIAENGREAAKIAREIPRVKRHHKDAILSVSKVSKEEFDYQNMVNKIDPYLLCKSKHEQNEIYYLLKDRLIPETNYERRDVSKYKKRKVNLFIQEKKYLLDSRFIYD